MSPLPGSFTDRWGSRTDRQSYQDAVCWHLLLGGHDRVRAAVTEAQQRLARFGGMHMTPARWLHVTVLPAGSAAESGEDRGNRMLARARAALAGVSPPTVILGRVLYHPEGIALGLSPAGALRPVLAAAQAATREATGADAGTGDPAAWLPHLTIAYSTGEQPAAPVIAELGKTVPACEVTLDRLSLVVQHGPEQLWDWRIAGTARMLGALLDGCAYQRIPAFLHARDFP